MCFPSVFSLNKWASRSLLAWNGAHSPQGPSALFYSWELFFFAVAFDFSTIIPWSRFDPPSCNGWLNIHFRRMRKNCRNFFAPLLWLEDIIRKKSDRNIYLYLYLTIRSFLCCKRWNLHWIFCNVSYKFMSFEHAKADKEISWIYEGTRFRNFLDILSLEFYTPYCIMHCVGFFN